MCKRYLFLVGFASALCVGCCAPPPIKKCKAEDTQCLTDSMNALLPLFAEGIPEYNFETFEPLYVKSINASQGNLLFEVTDATIVGLKNCKSKKTQRDKAKSKLNLIIVCSGTLDGNYVLKGSILVLPIEGKGKIHADLRSAQFNIDLNMADVIGDDGKSHWQIKSSSHTFDLKDKSDIFFDGLYDGNELLGRAARELAANNGNEIIKEIGPKVMKSLMQRMVKNINRFFKAVPSEDLALD